MSGEGGATFVPQFPSDLTFKRKIMSNGLVVVLFCVGLLAVSWAVGNPSAPAQPEDKDKGKDKKPAFRARAVRPGNAA